MKTDQAALNMAVAQAHIEGEARDPASVMDLYTDHPVLEIPGRGLRFEGRAAIEANYRRMFGAMAEVEVQPLERFATATRVVDDCIARFTLVREGMDNAPVPVGARAELRLLHVFHMQNGRIAREIVHEGWRAL